MMKMIHMFEKDIGLICSNVKISKEMCEIRKIQNVSYYIDCLNFLSIYIRWNNWSIVNGKIDNTKPRFVISNISVLEQFQCMGFFTCLIERLKYTCSLENVDLQVECVLDSRLQNFLEKQKFSSNNQTPPSFTWYNNIT
ncbi:hypothetical protein GHCGIGKI_00270 [Klebsiella phage P01]|nr:hypothetical protein GHCGIGKI_00270 [Klebsiella phage P01]